MSIPFDAWRRPAPDHPRGLPERIDAAVRERVEEAIEFACLDLLVQLRRARGRPAPATEGAGDREEFRGLVRDLLRHLSGRFGEALPAEDRERVSRAEEGHDEEVSRLVAGQVALARALPDYWQRFEALRGGFFEARLSVRPPRRGFLGRLLGDS